MLEVSDVYCGVFPRMGPHCRHLAIFHRMTNKETLGPHLARLGDITIPDGHG